MFLLAAFEIYLLISGNLYVNKVLQYTILSGKSGPDIDELHLFPSHLVKKGIPQPWPFSTRYGKSLLPDTTKTAFDNYRTSAFVVFQNDSLLFEYYNDQYTHETVSNSFSMAKSINAALIGCAIKDGLIYGIDDKVSDYLDAFKTPEKQNITLRHLLTMSSGIDFKENYASPFAWPAEAYYGPDVNALTLKADVANEPGKIFYYKGGDSQLLGMILRKVTRKNVANYASEKLWQPMGAESDAFWSTDEQDMEKVSCCYYATARDFARLAKLYMHKGNWNGMQLIDSTFISESIFPAPILDNHQQPNKKYGFQWWLMQHKQRDIFYMRGIRGQYVFAIPDLNMIVVRLGHKRAPKSGDDLPADIFLYLDAAIELCKPLP
jgi:CubicO group peptidase (beta-lactamase class C family)